MHRQPLHTISLDGTSQLVRNLLFGTIALCAGLVIGGFLTAAHTSTSIIVPSIAATLALTVAAGLRYLSFGAGIATGMVATISGAVVFLTQVSADLARPEIEYAYGDTMIAIGGVGLLLLGLVLAIVEPVVYVSRRHELERTRALQAADSPYPVVARRAS